MNNIDPNFLARIIAQVIEGQNRQNLGLGGFANKTFNVPQQTGISPQILEQIVRQQITGLTPQPVQEKFPWAILPAVVGIVRELTKGNAPSFTQQQAYANPAFGQGYDNKSITEKFPIELITPIVAIIVEELTKSQQQPYKAFTPNYLNPSFGFFPNQINQTFGGYESVPFELISAIVESVKQYQRAIPQMSSSLQQSAYAPVEKLDINVLAYLIPQIIEAVSKQGQVSPQARWAASSPYIAGPIPELVIR